MSAWTAIRTVAAREVSVQLRSKVYWITTAFVILVLGFGAMFGSMSNRSESAESRVGVVGVRPTLVQALRDQVAVAEYTDADAVQDALRDKDIDAAILPDDGVVVLKSLPAGLRQILQNAQRADRAARELIRLGSPESSVAQQLSMPVLRVDILDEDATAAMKRTITTAAGVLILFMMMFLAGMGIASGVAEEKSNRIVEILLAKIRPWQLLAGKVIGLGTMAMAQIMLLMVVAIGAAISTGFFDTPTKLLGIAAVLLMWFIPGFILFATIYAVAGALVSRQEDINQVILPVNLIQMLTLLGPLKTVTEPNSGLARILSLVPGFSWATMPVRMAGATVGFGEIAIAYLAMLVATAALVWIGGRIYAGGLLRVGGIVKLTEALRAAAPRGDTTARMS